MPQLRHWADVMPAKPALIMAESGRTVTYRDLDERANRVMHLLQAHGLRPGDGIAILLDNDPRYFEIIWAARRLGLYFTPVAKHLKPGEAIYVIGDCGASVVFLARSFADIAERLLGADDAPAVFILDADVGDPRDYQAALLRFDGHAAIPEAPEGTGLLYSSGTTGRPKGIRRPKNIAGDWMKPLGFGDDTVYLSPAPLYHAAPLLFCLRTLAGGGSVVVMSRFDPVNALAAIEAYEVTHSQWVPTMFFRLLSLPEETRSRFDFASHRCALHAAAPCPQEVKERMIAWWGPIIWEYYAGSEGNGLTLISTQEWLEHRGSVGKAAVGTVHILDDDGRELGPGEIGGVYFDGPVFEYHNDPEKTARSRSPQGWSTLGDIGYLDEAGYLYLTDRRAFTIISGGVNIYPVEIENVLSLHPAVRDVAVFGIPSAEFGEEVKAAVELHDPGRAGAELEGELIAYCRERLSHIKCPRSIDFHAALPRQETGKLLKHVLREPYWQKDSAAQPPRVAMPG